MSPAGVRMDDLPGFALSGDASVPIFGGLQPASSLPREAWLPSRASYPAETLKVLADPPCRRRSGAGTARVARRERKAGTMSSWYDREPFDASPATWKGMRDALFAAYAKVPVPPGVESIADTNPRSPAATVIVGGETVNYYSAHDRPWVTVAGPDGYAEFRLDDGAWTYVASAPILFDPFDGGFGFDDLGAAEVAALTATVSPPTIAEAFKQWGDRQEDAD